MDIQEFIDGMSEQQRNDQQDELSALQSIFPDEFAVSKSAYPIQVSLPIHVCTPLAMASTSPTTKIQRSKRGTAQSSVAISHLPPLVIAFALPPTYPSSSPPLVRLQCDHGWVPQTILISLEHDIERLWEECGRTAVLFSFITHVQEASQDGFGLERLHVSPDLQATLLAYDAEAARQDFCKSSFTCGICFEVKRGDLCFCVRECGHVFCVACLQGFYTMAIQEGTISAVRCLDADCPDGTASNEISTEARKIHLFTPKDLYEMGIEPQLIERYTRLRIKKLRERDPDTIWCPRNWCDGVVETDRYTNLDLDNPEDLSKLDRHAGASLPSSSSSPPLLSSSPTLQATPVPPKRRAALAICGTCAFAFCSGCLTSWHGAHTPCAGSHEALEDKKPKAIPKAIPKVTPKEMPKTKRKIKLNKDDRNFLRDCTKCPGCKAPYEKAGGCSHMRCTNCDAQFCDGCFGRLRMGDWVHIETGTFACPTKGSMATGRGFE